MRKTAITGLLAAALALAPLTQQKAAAQFCGGCNDCGGCGGGFGFGFGFKVNVKWNASCSFCGPCGNSCGGGCPSYGCGGWDGSGAVSQCGPWYLYWPTEAHFQTPAPTGYPYWPAPQTLPPDGAYRAPAPANFMPASLQPSGYGAPAPSYWSR